MSTNNAYHLSEEWVKINESTGYLHNTSQQNIEYIVVPVGVEPIENSGAVIMPRNYHYFELPEGKEMYVRVFRKMPSGYIPTAVVNSEADEFRQADNNLEGSTNSLSIGLSTWRQTAWYPLEWCVIALGSIWQCIEAHEPSTNFRTDVDAGYWRCLTTEGSCIATVSFTNDGKMKVTYTDGSQEYIDVKAKHSSTADTADKANKDGNGNNIADTYMTRQEVTNALGNYTTTSAMNTAINNAASTAQSNATSAAQTALNSAVSSLNSSISAAQTALTNLGNNAIINAQMKNDYTVRLTKGSGANIDLVVGDNTYISYSALNSYLSPYAKTSNVTASINSAKSELNTTIDGVASTAASNLNTAKTQLQKNIDGVASTAASNLNTAKTQLNTTIDGVASTAASNLNTAKTQLQNNIDTLAASVVTNVSATATAIKQTKNGTTSTVLTIDTTLDSSSTNPVQNKAIKAALDSAIAGIGGTKTITIVQSNDNYTLINNDNPVTQTVTVKGENNTSHTTTFTAPYGSSILISISSETGLTWVDGVRYSLYDKGASVYYGTTKLTTTVNGSAVIPVLENITITGLGFSKTRSDPEGPGGGGK